MGQVETALWVQRESCTDSLASVALELHNDVGWEDLWGVFPGLLGRRPLWPSHHLGLRRLLCPLNWELTNYPKVYGP